MLNNMILAMTAEPFGWIVLIGTVVFFAIGAFSPAIVGTIEENDDE